MDDVLKSDYYKSPLGYDNVGWFVNEVIKIENKMAFYFKNTQEDVIITEKDEEDFKNNDVCRFYEKKLRLIKLEISVILPVNTKVQLITLVISMLHRNKVILFHSYLII